MFKHKDAHILAQTATEEVNPAMKNITVVITNDIEIKNGISTIKCVRQAAPIP